MSFNNGTKKMQIEYVNIFKIKIKIVLYLFYSEKSRREDTGKYELILRNAKGEVKIPIDVTVLGKMSFFMMKSKSNLIV
jgi:nitrate reductase assembly molybdenum cofactor insertion protein NarJ